MHTNEFSLSRGAKLTQYLLILTALLVFLLPALLLPLLTDAKIGPGLSFVGIACFMLATAFNPGALMNPRLGFKTELMPLRAKIFYYAGCISFFTVIIF